ncbi:MAG: AarF/ABC1/UbiB kinase family protein [Alphaproteobacteria bacterium]|nr:AarF/ABC1/UbiB kinase family protein [Alphaproteobacteria bacterium]MDA7989059.1 AarF/ABC1/UbiB kinase family protein [Alphaproteobacteria bacterium]MDA8009694.1 AarF/ABC1/UbiB kinase family protein [Alphaproteobacteria bacterium]
MAEKGASGKAAKHATGSRATELRAAGSRADKRLRRHARLGGEASGVALRMLLSRLTGNDGSNPETLRAALGSLKGPVMKIAQILATIPDALPAEYAEALRELQANAPPMSAPFVRRRMRAELGDGWRDCFSDFDLRPAAAASLGQVHRAVADGRRLACKLQYPDMASAVSADLAQLRLAFSLYRRYDRAVDAGAICDELAERLVEELDYGREARHMRLYGALLGGEGDIVIPEPVDDLSTGRLLTMTWLDGDSLPDYLRGEPSQEERDRLAECLFRAWYLPFYRCGVIHGDPHLGNYTFARDGGVARLNLMDFGCVRVFSPPFVQGVVDLYYATRDGDRDLAVHAYEAWGFDDIGGRPDLLEALNIWARFIYGPLIEDRVQPLVDGHRVAAAGGETAARVHSAIRAAGGVRPPQEFVLMDRSAIGLASVFSHLRAEVNWHRVFHGLADGFAPEEMGVRQAEALRAAGLSGNVN